MGKRYFSGIDAVRFFAALIVGVHHLGFTAWLGGRTLPAMLVKPAVGAAPVIDWGWATWVGVEIFFVISGIVIAGSALGRAPLDFIKGRILRLYPAVWFGATLALLIILLLDVDSHYPLLKWGTAMLISPVGPWIDPVFWTLSVEIVFYLLVATWLGVGRISLETLASTLAVASGAYLLLAELMDIALPREVERPLLLRHGGFFALGILMWSWGAGRLLKRFYPMLFLALCVSTFEVVTKTLQAATEYFGDGDIPYRHLPVALFLLAVVGMGLSLFFASDKRPNAALRSMGMITYPLYLTHTTVGGALIWLLMGIDGVNATMAFILGMIGATSFAWATSVYVEPRIKGALADLLGRIQFGKLKQPSSGL